MKKLTKREKEIIQRYNESGDLILGDAYDRPSELKKSIFNKHFNEYKQDETASRFRIISFNAQMFTIGYTTIKDGVTYLRYISKTKDELIRMEATK